MIVKFKRAELTAQFTKYADNDRIAIILKGKRDRELVATVNIPEVALDANEVIVKDYSENEGVFEALINAGIVEYAGRSVASGFVTCPVARLLIPSPIN